MFRVVVELLVESCNQGLPSCAPDYGFERVSCSVNEETGGERYEMIIDTTLVERGLNDKKFSVIELAQGTGLSRQAIYNIRNGETQIERIELQSAAKVQNFLNANDYK